MCVGIYCVLTLLYVMQLSTLVLYCFDSEDRNLDIDVCTLRTYHSQELL